ncbi:phage portal protein [Azospirillum sp.]|uniref:phage portal protein n=1 Tax=Azospirillum sp. TaxID=34012 RepID=UPI002D47B897|nr:phage portal protein [Azospirillum sp.]HYF88984.1 phage portal protein [Azospirillum sp.]
MALFGLFGRGQKARDADAVAHAMGVMAQVFDSLDDPALKDFMRGAGGETQSGAVVNADTALRNAAVLRCVSVISKTIGMLPLQLFKAGEAVEKATDHPLYRILMQAPNDWQTPFTFKSTMQARALLHGSAYAYPVRSRGRIVRLFPLEPSRVEVRQNDDWSVEYRYTRRDGGVMTIPAAEMFHLRDVSLDGLEGVSRVKLAREAIGLALRAEQAASKLFKNGMMLGGYLTTTGRLSKDAIDRLKEQMEEYRGAESAQGWPVFEEGLKAEKLAQTSVESQHLENRRHQIEEVARAFDVPRPLLMMDETSWGSGIAQLGLFFIQYGLAPWFKAWEEEVSRVLLTEGERDGYYAKFNEKALLRGTPKDQAEFFAKALGAGGHDPWMMVDEVRGLSELPRQSGDASKLQPGYGRKTPPASEGGSGNEPAQPA